MMDHSMFKFFRIIFSGYLLCVVLLLLVKLFVFSAPWEEQGYLTGLILHPAAGMIIGFPRNS